VAGKLKKGDISIAEVFRLSRDLFRSKKVDNKERRAKMDVTSAKVSTIKNFTFDKNVGKWKTTNKRSVKFEFIVRTKPISYKKRDRIPTHIYPVFFVLYDIEQGVRSAFRYRSGGLKKPLFAPKGCSAEKRLKIEEQNIRNGTDMHFFYSLEKVLQQYGLLYGICYANRLPRKTNPQLLPYMEKHSFWCVLKLLIPILHNPTSMSKIKNMVVKNESRIEK
jgi:hypothetical protein